MTETLHLINDIQDVPKLGDWIEGLGEKWDLPLPQVFNLNLALEEAVVNVMNYAYPHEKGKPITVTANKDSEAFYFVIEDEGIPFDPTKAENPDITLDADERPIGGLGIFLVQELMSRISYERKDNKNILSLYV